MTEEELEITSDSEKTQETPPAEDPVKSEVEELKKQLAEERKLREQQMLAFLSQRPAQPEPVVPQQPDFTGLPHPSDDPEGFAKAYWSRQKAFELARQPVQQHVPEYRSDEEFVASLVNRFPGVDRDAAEGAAHRVAREVRKLTGGPVAPGTPAWSIVERQIEDAVRMKVEKVTPQNRTSGTGGGSRPASITPVPKTDTTDDPDHYYKMIRAVQKKRGLY